MNTCTKIEKEHINALMNGSSKNEKDTLFNRYQACRDKVAINFLRSSHNTNKFNKFIYTKSEYKDFLLKANTTPYEISTLAPGKSLFLLLNAYASDPEGLPEKYLFSFTNIDKIEYSISGFDYLEENIKPLGMKRMGIIKSPSGAIGGQ